MHILWFGFTNSRTLSIWRIFLLFISALSICRLFEWYLICFQYFFFLLGNRAFLIFIAFGSVFSFFFCFFLSSSHPVSPRPLPFRLFYRPLAYPSLPHTLPFSRSFSLFFNLPSLAFYPITSSSPALVLYLSKWIFLWFELPTPNEIIPTRERSRRYL